MNIRIRKPLCFSELGKKPNQEDSLYPHEGQASAQSHVLLVCDGMGGHEHGEVASSCVADTIGQLMESHPVHSAAETRTLFEQALATAYQEPDKLDQSSDSIRKMGTTLTFLALCTDGILVAHIGDSRVYQMRRGKGVVFQTHDHSLLNDLIAAGELDEEGARNFDQKNVITRAVMPHQEYPSKATFKVLTDVRQGDLFFLCCDGIVEQIENPDLTAILLTNQPLQQRLDMLKAECAKRGTRDNHSCYAFEVEDVEGIEMVAVEKMDESAKEPNTVNPTLTMPPKPKKSSRLPYVILSILIGLGVILALLYFFVLKNPVFDHHPDAEQPAEQMEQMEKTEQTEKVEKKNEDDAKVQGPIQRTKGNEEP